MLTSLTDLIGLNDLTQAVADSLKDQKGGKLRMIWIASQIYRADLKKQGWYLLFSEICLFQQLDRTQIANHLVASMTGCIDQYWRVIKVSKIPLIPVICVWTLGSAYFDVLGKLNQIWGLRTDPPNIHFRPDFFLEDEFLSAIFDASGGSIAISSAALATYNAGPLAGSLTAKITLKIIVGLTLIHERLFLAQQRDSGAPLTQARIEQEVRGFRRSAGRKLMYDIIEREITLGNCYKRGAAEKAARLALRAGKSRFGNQDSKKGFGELYDAL